MVLIYVVSVFKEEWIYHLDSQARFTDTRCTVHMIWNAYNHFLHLNMCVLYYSRDIAGVGIIHDISSPENQD